MFESVGLDVPAILAEAGIDAAVLACPDHRASTEMVSHLWRVAAEHSGNPAISLFSAHVPKSGNFDIVGYAMLSSQSLRVAIQNFARHLRLVSDAASIHLDYNAESVRLQLHLFGGREPIPRQRVEFNLLTMLTFCRWVSGRPIKPLGLFLVWPAPSAVAPFEDAFQCPLHFEADFNGLDFARSDFEANLPGSNVDLAGLHEDLVQRRLAVLDGLSVSAKVRDEIIRLLVDGEPRREQVAHALNLSERTLTRRLQQESVSYQKLLDETRRDLAQNYLARPNMSLAEVAYLLGFADQSAFFRSCKRWFDVSPGQFRAHLSGLSKNDRWTSKRVGQGSE
ncbi:MAG: AraC family transcriptional regulator [Alphaproteobacteria bacterium]|nr:AraC family transcriptional regulator [Alphaproteobacteria bacterium]